MSESAMISDIGEAPNESPPQVFPELQWRWQDIVIGLIPIALARVLVGVIPHEKFGTVSLAMTAGIMGWIWFYPLCVARLRGARFRRPGLEASAFEAVIAIPTTIVIWISLGLIMGAILLLFPQIDRNTNPFLDSAIGDLRNPRLWVLMLVACTAGPIGEEFFFRGMLYQWLRQHVDLKSAILIQGVLFGFAHTFGFLHAVMASCLGIAFAIVYEWRKTIVTPVCLHLIQNTAAMTATILMAIVFSWAPVLGVYGEARVHGFEVTQVQPASGAAEAGIVPGDVIVDFGGKQITDLRSLRMELLQRRVGERVNLRVFRDNKMQTIVVPLKGRETSPAD